MAFLPVPDWLRRYLMTGGLKNALVPTQQGEPNALSQFNMGNTFQNAMQGGGTNGFMGQNMPQEMNFEEYLTPELRLMRLLMMLKR